MKVTKICPECGNDIKSEIAQYCCKCGTWFETWYRENKERK